MLSLLEKLPVELTGTHLLGNLSLKDLVILERACGSKKSHQLFLTIIPRCPPIAKLNYNCKIIAAFNWFAQRRCRIQCLGICLPGYNPCLEVEKLQVGYYELYIESEIKMQSLQPLLESSKRCNINNVVITGDQNREVMEQLCDCTGNVKQVIIKYSTNCMDWLTADILSKWKLTEFDIKKSGILSNLIILLVQACSELTSIKLQSDNIDDDAVIAIVQHCPKLEILHMATDNITWTTLLALSERGLPLKELQIPYIPNIPTVDIARRCSHALSCIPNLSTAHIHQNSANILIPYMTGLTSMCFNSFTKPLYIPLLVQYFHKLTKIAVRSSSLSVSDILSLCCANPLLQVFACYSVIGFTDTTLIELIHACPHLYTLDLSYETNISDIGILALSEHCPQLQVLSISKCHKVTEAAVLQLLQRCRKLTILVVSSSSLSEETWTQLDKNTQKRVSRSKLIS